MDLLTRNTPNEELYAMLASGVEIEKAKVLHYLEASFFQEVIVPYILKRGGSVEQAEDMFSLAMAELLKKTDHGTLKPTDKIRALLVTITKNKFFSLLRRSQQHETVAHTYEERRTDQNESSELPFENIEEVRRIAYGLIGTHGHPALVMYLLDGKSQFSIMEELGFANMNTTRSTISAAVRRLRTWLDAHPKTKRFLRECLDSFFSDRDSQSEEVEL